MDTVTSADGTRVAYERTGSGSPLVLVHGTGLDHVFWDLSAVRDALAAHHTVYAIDRRGRRESGDADEYALEREVEDVVEVVESIEEPVTLIGHSYGALIALEAALHTDNVRGLILYDAFALEEGLPPLEQLTGALQALLADGETEQALITLPTAVGLPEASIDELRSHPSWQGLVDAAYTIPREFEQLIGYEFDTDRFTGMSTPTLLLTGSETPQPVLDATETVDQTLPKSRVVVFDGHGHWAMITATDRFISEVLTFARELTPGPGGMGTL